MNKTILLKFCIILFLPLMVITGSCKINAGRSSISIALLTGEHSQGAEISEIQKILNTRNISCTQLDISSINAYPSALGEYDLLWYHRTDTTAPDNVEKACGETISNYLDKGGKLILTLDAVTLLGTWGIENGNIESETIEVKDYGFGRNRGFHSYISHPVFDGLNGGAYTWHSDMDHRERRTGFFNDNVPQAKGSRVIGIDWGYITYFEDTKLLWETPVGEGKILACGAYTHYAPFNFNQQQLARFTLNMIDYLTSEEEPSPSCFWNYSDPVVVEEPGVRVYEGHINSTGWKVFNDKMSLYTKDPDANYDIGGERITLFGKNNAGVDEMWIHPVMSFMNIQSAVVLNESGETIWLSELEPNITKRPESLTRLYDIHGHELREIITADKEQSVAVIHYEWKEDSPFGSLIMTCESNMRLMWPYSHHTTRKLGYSWDKSGTRLEISSNDDQFTSITAFSAAPVEKIAGRYENLSYDNNAFISNTSKNIQLAAGTRFDLNELNSLDICFAGMQERDQTDPRVINTMLSKPSGIHNEAFNYYKELFNERLMIETDDTVFNQAYKWAVVASDQFKVNTPGIGKSLMAGYSTTDHGWGGNQEISGRPGYAWYFGRDAEWSGLAFNMLGDFSLVRNILETFNRYMDLNGKVYHELTTSGSVHYDAADATPLYIILTGHYLRYSGDMDYLEKNIEYLRLAVDYCFSTDTDRDGLIENTNVGHGWIEGGKLYGAHTTFYLAGLWGAALDEAAYIERLAGNLNDAEYYNDEAERVRNIIDTRFWNKNKKSYYYGLNRDGSMADEVTVLPSVPVLLGQTDREKSSMVVERYASSSFSSDWGVRILEKESDLYNPAGYHYGSIYPLFTGWAALSEFKTDRFVQGFVHAVNNLLIYQDWNIGGIEEVVHGEIYKPSGVCSHQCWSETMAIQPLIQGLMSPEPDAFSNSISVAPHFPASWNNALVSNIPVGNNKINCRFVREENGYALNFSLAKGEAVKIAVTPYIPEGVFKSEVSIDNVVYSPDQPAKIKLDKEGDNITIKVNYKGAVQVLPYTSKPQPGDKSEGIRLLKTTFGNNIYTVLLEKPANTDTLLKLRTDRKINNVEGARIVDINKDIVTLLIPYSSDNINYCKEEIKLYML